MLTTIILRTTRETYALCKTTNEDKARAVHALCELQLGKLYPGADLITRYGPEAFDEYEMHPEKEMIFAKMREAEFPFPRETVIEGDCVTEGV